jgi:putative hydrolase of the HAD superfamily
MDTILFDLDDTLILELKSAEDSFIETISLLNPSIDREEFVKTITLAAREQWHQLPTIDYCRKIGISSREGLWAEFNGDHEQIRLLHELIAEYRLKTWRQALSVFKINDLEIAEKLSLEFIRIRNSKHILFPEAIPVLDKLRSSYKLGLITNGDTELQWKKIDGGGLRKYFNVIVVSGEYGFAKPDTRLFEAALKGLKSEKSDAVMVGDRLNTDIKGARENGLMTVWVNRESEANRGAKETPEILPDFEISDLSQVHDILNGLKHKT